MANMNRTAAANGAALFPMFDAPRRSALGRAAAEGEFVDAGHDVEFRALESRSILNRSVSKRLKWMAWSINPYRGCEFACRYCYARYTHEFLEAAGQTAGLRAPEAFERQIFVKQNGPWLLEQDLRRLARQGRLEEEIALGTATDPWQPIERRTGLTRSLLEVLSRHDGIRLGVVTKSTLIERDIDLLREIDRRGTLVVHVTVTTADAELARKLEPRAPRPDLRLQTVKRLSEAGLRVGVLNSPLLPGITDGPAAIDGMAQRAAAAGAHFFSASPLFLKSCSRPTYFEFVREHFPHLQVEYMERFRNMDFADRTYRERLVTLVRASCRRHGLAERLGDTLLTREAGEEGREAVDEGPRGMSVRGTVQATTGSRSAFAKKPSVREGEIQQGRLFA